MAMAVDHQMDMDIAPASEAAPEGSTSPVRQRRGLLLRRMYAPVGAAEHEASAAAAAGVDAAADADDGAARKPRRGGWLRHALRRRWKMLSAASSRLAAGLRRGKRAPGGLSVGGGGGWASELLDAAAFRVMYVVEAVVLGLALSCFFCCCGCQI